MIEIVRGTFRKVTKEQKGQVLPISLILLVLGGLLIIPTFNYCSTSLKGQQVVESKALELYAADAGVEDGLWQIENDQLADLFAGYTPAYDPYAYSDYNHLYKWEYSLTEDIQDINGKGVDVTIKNVWVPNGLAAPSPGQGRQIIENGKLIITGSVISLDGSPGYEIKITYYYERDDEEPYYDPGGENLKVGAIGIWLPPGFSYVAGSSSLEDDPLDPYYCVPVTQPYKSGEAVVWNFSSVGLNDFPGDSGYPMQRTVTFEFSSDQLDRSPGAALSWITTTGVGDVPFAWDADVKVYEVSSVATDPTTWKQTTVEAHTAKVEMRKLGAAISGDYCAIGATLLTATGTGQNARFRDRLFRESSAAIAVGDIPSAATIEAAYLYWSGWIEGGGEQTKIWEDHCSNFSNWDGNEVADWEIYYWYGDSEFQGHHSGSESDRLLTLNPGVVDLGVPEYQGKMVTISWEQRTGGTLESDDCLEFQFSADGGSSWGEPITAFCDDLGYWGETFVHEIPEGYLTGSFRMRFYLDGFNEGWGWEEERCYIDDISISVSSESSVEEAKINRVMFNGNQITAAQCQTEPNPEAGDAWGATGGENSWSYSCFYDATDIVIAGLDPVTKSGSFTLGHVLEGEGYDLYPSGTTAYPLATPATWGYGGYPAQYEWAYAGWSLIVIYSSVETKGHQLYLFDRFRYIAPHTEGLKFALSGFLVPDPIAGETNAAKITCFVGDGDEVYSGDFIAINAPDVPGHQIPEAYKLWDGITVPAPSFPPYMPNTVNSPNNAWNSQSVGLTASGIDIDTFYVPWGNPPSAGLIKPGDSSAEVVLNYASSNPDGAELIDFIYVIISFRSEITSGGTLSYLIVG